MIPKARAWRGYAALPGRLTRLAALARVRQAAYGGCSKAIQQPCKGCAYGLFIWRSITGTHHLSRRRFAGSAATLGIAAAAAGLVGCGSTNNKNNAAKTSASAVAGAQSTAVPAAPAAATRAGAPAAAASAIASRASTPAVLDSTKGKPGGTLKYMTAAFPRRSRSSEQRSPYSFAAFTHSGLLAMHWGTQGVDYDDYILEPDLAQAMPEQPDQTTYVFKLRPAQVSERPRRDLAGRASTPTTAMPPIPRRSTVATGRLVRPHRDARPADRRDQDENSVRRRAGGYERQLRRLHHGQGVRRKPGRYDEDRWAADRTFLRHRSRPSAMTFKKNPDYFLKPYPYFRPDPAYVRHRPGHAHHQLHDQAGTHALACTPIRPRPDQTGSGPTPSWKK